MNKMKMIMAGVAAVVAMGTSAATITDVTAKQRYPWNGKVDITYVVTGDLDSNLALMVSAEDGATGASYCASATALSGDTGKAKGIHHVVWDLDAQGVVLKSTDVVFTVEYGYVKQDRKRYCVVDLSNGRITHMDSPPSGGFNKDEYKTTKLVLRLIESYRTPFFCGLFEVTKGQCDLMGGAPVSNWDGLSYRKTLPVESVSYSAAKSYANALRARTGLEFDLPKEAQWEYACRAGTTTDYNSGKNNTGKECANMDEVGRYWYNGGADRSKTCAGTAKVGSYTPNAWGLYDMHGNVLEWCSDSSGNKRIMRGGAWLHAANECTSSYRYAVEPSKDFPLTDPSTGKLKFYECGFRLVINIPSDDDAPASARTLNTVKIDTEMSPVDSLSISWNAGWIGGDTNVTVVIADNGTVVRRTTGTGEFTWVLSGDCRHELTYTTYINGVAQDEVYKRAVYAPWAKWKYDIEDGGAIITGIMNTEGAVTIPEEFEGLPVTGIKTFAGGADITSLTIPNCVTKVVPDALSDCAGLKDITVPQCICTNHLSSIFPSAYQSITNVVISDGVTSIGAFAFHGCHRLTSVSIPDSVTTIGERAFSNCSELRSVMVGAGVTNIGASAFAYCQINEVHIKDIAKWCEISFENDGISPGTANPLYNAKKLYLNGTLIEELTIPDGVTKIGEYAFCRCKGLTSVTIPGSVTRIGGEAFYGCSSITNVTIGNGVTKIGSWAFEDCSGLTSVTIGNGVTSIGGDAFKNCNGLKAVYITDLAKWCGISFGLTSWWSTETMPIVFANPLYYAKNLYLNGTLIEELTIPDSVTNIGWGAFYGFTGFKSAMIPDSVKSIASGAFDGCSSITNVTIGNGVTNIGWRAFGDCSGLTSVTIGNGVTSIGGSAFKNCGGITSVKIPDSVTGIATNAFSGCTNLTSVMLGDIAPSIVRDAFDSWCTNLRSVEIAQRVSRRNLSLVFPKTYKSITNVIIRDGVTSIAASAFEGCGSLTSVTIPSSVTNIGYRAFYGCSRLKAVYITDIAKWCEISFGGEFANPLCYAKNLFLNGSEVDDLTIPDSVKSIGGSAFKNYSGLTSVTIPNSVTNIGSYAFQNCSGLTSVTIPDSVTSIGYRAFYGCSGLTSMTIPSSVTSIEAGAFEGCDGITDVTVPQSNSSYGSLCLPFSSPILKITNVVIQEGATYIGDCAFLKCPNLISVKIPDSVTDIATNAFEWCTKLTSVMLGDIAPSIVRNAFGSCCTNLRNVVIAQGVSSSELSKIFPKTYQSITNVVIREGVTSVGDSAFRGCAGLKSVTIPASAMQIGEYAFAGCTSLVQVTMPKRFDGNLPSTVFANCPNSLRIKYLNCFEVYFDANSGSVGEPMRWVYDGDVVGRLPQPVRYGYEFNGWFTDPLSGDRLNETTPILKSITFYAQWTMIEGGMQVFLSQEGGSGGTLSVVAFYDYALPSIEVPTRPGYTFGGYWTGGCGEGTLYYTESGKCAHIWDQTNSRTLYAKWNEVEKYAVTLDQQNGSGGTLSVMAIYDSPMPDIIIPTRPGYRFDGYWIGWNGNGTQYYTASGKSAHEWDKMGEATLYAKWTAVEPCTVTFDRQSGSGGTANVTATYGSAMPPITVPTRSGYMFGGYWSGTNGSGTQYYTASGLSARTWDKTSATTLYAQWGYAVTLDQQGGSGGTSNLVASYNGAMPLIDIPIRAGYTFGGYFASVNGGGTQYYTASGECSHAWDKASAATLYAVWLINQYTVTFDANGGTGGKTITQNYGTALSAPMVTRTGYTFDGWSPSVPYMVTAGNATYTAQWKVNQYTVTFDANGGTGGKTITQDYGTALSAPTVARAGYTFKDWSPTVPQTVPNGNVTYKAQWTANQYTVAFDMSGGTGGSTSVMATYGSAMPAISVPMRTGYTFSGYYTSPDGNGAQYYTKSGTSARTWDETGVTTLYAKWTANTYVVTLDQQGGSGGTESVTATYDSPMPSITVPKRAGYRFAGYWTGKNGDGTQYYTASGASVRNCDMTTATTLYAKWLEGEEFTPSSTYCVIDLSAGTNAVSYPVTYMAEAPEGGFNTSEYKTTKLVLRMIEPGMFKMGGSYDVMLTKPFYCGVFEVTQKQYELVMGSKPSSSKGDMRPVEQVSWNTIRGNSSTYNWPSTTQVEPSSFIGKLQSRTGISFDLPTEAQWEYACRAGTTNAYNNGGASESDLKKLGRYKGNASDGKGGYSYAHTTVGSYLPNAWGLYDMHGNVYEWRLDWYGGLNGGVTDPEGPSSASGRVVRGGGWDGSYASYCTSSYRLGDAPSSVYADSGFRIVRTGCDSYIILSFNLNDGSAGTTNTIQLVAPDAALPVPTREGYTFDGWWTSANGGTRISNETDAISGTFLYAHWKVNRYTVTFDANGGTGGKTVTQDYGTALSAPAVTREHYTFEGWSPAVAATVPANDVTYTAQWKVNQYTVTFDANGGTGGKSAALDYGSAITAPIVTREGYTFTGWSPVVAATVPADDVTYTAQWKVNQYTVTFDANGGTGGDVRSYDYGDTIWTTPTPVRSGWVFTGWYMEPVGGNPFEDWSEVTEDVTYYAHWEDLSSRLAGTLGTDGLTFTTGGDGNWEVGGGGARSGAIGNCGETWMETSIEGPVIVSFRWMVRSEPGCDVLRWYVDGEEQGAISGYVDWTLQTRFLSAGMHTVRWAYAKDTGYSESFDCGWVKALQLLTPYTVTFDANGREGGWSSNMVYGAAITAPEVTRVGYVFDGWDPAPAATVPASDVTYYAQWKIIDEFVEQTITIQRAGWNLVSFNVLPDDPSPEAVFADVADSIQSVVSGTRRWTPQSGGRLAALQIGVGYWVKTTRDNVVWTIRGKPDEAVEINVNQGWNLVGYPLLEAGAPEAVLQSAAEAGIVSSVVSGTRRWTPQSGGRLTEMTPGVGYWLKAAKSGTIKFDK